MDTLGDRIRYLREVFELKQKDVSKDLSMQHNTWNQYEKNKRTPNIEILKSISQYFNVSVDYLLGIINEPYNPHEETFKAFIHIYNKLDDEEKRQLVGNLKIQYKIE